MKKQRGFTLLEVVVVLGILVILAGVLVSQLDSIQSKGQHAVASSNMSGLDRYLRTYRSTHSTFPDNWDSLMTTTGTLWAPGAPGGLPGLDPNLVGGPPIGSRSKLTLATALTDAEARSLQRAGINNIFDCDVGFTGVPGNAFGATATSATPRAIQTGVVVATLNGTDSSMQKVIDQIYYPQNVGGTSGALPAGVKLAVVGLGPRNDLVRGTNANALLEIAPNYIESDMRQYYSKYLCVFETKSSGSRARLVAVLGADGDYLGDLLQEFFQ